MNTFKQNIDSITYEHIQTLRDLKASWSAVVDLISFSQYVRILDANGQVITDYKAKALKVKTLSKSKKVHVACDAVISNYNKLKGA